MQSSDLSLLEEAAHRPLGKPILECLDPELVDRRPGMRARAEKVVFRIASATERTALNAGREVGRMRSPGSFGRASGSARSMAGVVLWDPEALNLADAFDCGIRIVGYNKGSDRQRESGLGRPRSRSKS